MNNRAHPHPGLHARSEQRTGQRHLPGGVGRAVSAPRAETGPGSKPKPDRALSFSLACATGFLELVNDEDAHELMRNTQNVIAVQAILQAQQAAMAAAAVSASAAATASS